MTGHRMVFTGLVMCVTVYANCFEVIILGVRLVLGLITRPPLSVPSDRVRAGCSLSKKSCRVTRFRFIKSVN